MGQSKRLFTLCGAGAVAISAAASGCFSGDGMVCLNSQCNTYYGVGGSPPTGGDDGGVASAPGDAGESGSAGAGGESADAGSDPQVDPAPPDGGPIAQECEIAFTLPVVSGSADLTLDGASDVDGDACGASFALAVSVSSNANSVTLFVNDNPFSTEAVADGSAAFEAVLGNRGSSANVLRAEATMADGSTCSVTLPSNILVDCAGPSCSVDYPVANDAGYLNAEQDVDGATGFQVDIGVGTEVEHAGQTVRLEIDGIFGEAPDATVLDDNGAGVATFGNISLPEGAHNVRAECRDAAGVTTLSAPVNWDVDVTPCTLTLAELAGGAALVTPGSDIDSNSPGIQVLATGTITGGDCNTLWIGMCSGTPVPVPLTLPENGSFSLPVTITGSTGLLDICGAVEDDAGNMSEEEQAALNLRLEAPQVALVSPAGNTRYNILGGTGVLPDGNSLTSACEASVVVNCTEVGQPVLLLADGVQIASATCAALDGVEPFLGQASFSAAAIPSKNDGTNSALTAQHGTAGFEPVTSVSVSVQADCEAPACSLVGPDSSIEFLNADLDSSGANGFQSSFQVQSDSNSAGQNVQLTIDGSSAAPPATLVALGGGVSGVTFTDVDLNEGARTVQATCVDAAGNSRASAAEGWTVDTVGCGSSLAVASAANPITPNQDDDGDLAGLQVLFNGTTTGGDCTTARIFACSNPSGVPTSLTGQSFSLSTTLPSVTGSSNVCVEITDQAGNVETIQETFAVRVDPPAVAIISPANNATFNLSSPAQCTATLEATCTDNGEPVALFVDGAVAPADVQTCQGNLATFSLPLLTKNDGSTTSLAVQQTADGLESELDSITVQADCEAPLLIVTTPTCGGFVGLATADVNSSAPGLQTDVTVSNGGIAAVTLSVTRAGNTVDTAALGNAVSTTFSAVTLGGEGTVELAACAFDPQGNQGCSGSCSLNIAGEPEVEITSPVEGQTVAMGNDCGVASGLQVTVVGTTNAADGSTVDVQIGSATAGSATVAAGSFSACVDAPHGSSQVVTAQVTDILTGLGGSDSVALVVNALPSMGAPTPVVENRRQGLMRFNWTAIAPTNATLTSYQLRCSKENINDETKWANATPVDIVSTPAAPNTPQTEVVANFRTGTSRFCAIRAIDSLGFMTPIGPGESATVVNAFLTNAYTVTTTSSLRIGLAAIGDINGDGSDDFIAGSENNGAQVFFGGPTLDTTPDVTITGPGSPSRFGSVVTGLGDINADGRPDFSVSAPALNNGGNGQGSVFVLFGRATGNPWPSSIAVSASPGCGADLCFHGAVTNALLGSPVAAADFDGSGTLDIVISASNQGPLNGRVYVLLGGAHLASGSIFTLPTTPPAGFQIDPTVVQSSFGASLAPVGTGADAFGDLVIGAVGRTVGNVPGAAYFVTGRAYSVGTGLELISATLGMQFATGNPAQYAVAMGGVGDFNGDSHRDVCVVHDFQTANGGGSCSLFLGRSPGDGGGYISSSVLEFTNDVGDNDWGFFVAQSFYPGLGLLGDLDNDGLGELLLGSQTVGAFNQGTADLFYGAVNSPARTRRDADMTFNTVDSGHTAPNFVGDINGDGFKDLAVFDTDVGSTSRVTLLY